jgi:hypothetical protein
VDISRIMSSCPSTTNLNPQLNYQYNYNYGSTYGPDDAQHRQLHRIWETGPEGELLINRNNISSTLSADPSSTAPRHMFLDIYLPNDLLLPIQCPAQRTLALLKQDVFIQARKYAFKIICTLWISMIKVSIEQSS